MVGTAVNVALALAHIEVDGVLMLTDGVTLGLTVILILLDVAVVGDAQARLLVITQVTAALLAIVVEVKVALLVPALTPLTLHWYEGDEPPLVGVAVNVTDEPLHIVVADAAMLNAGVLVADVTPSTKLPVTLLLVQ